jgi:hypothetical protein
MYLRAERVFILDHYLAEKSLAALCKEFSNAHHDKEVANKGVAERVVTAFCDTGSVCL